MLNFKKLGSLALAGCMAALSLAMSAGAVDANRNNISEADRIYAETGMRLVSRTSAEVTYTQPKSVAVDPAEEIAAVTGMRLMSRTSSPVQYCPVTLAEGAIVRAVSKPTQEASSYPYTQNWSGTVSYTYTNRYFRTNSLGADFDASASGAFYADFYKLDGTYLGGVPAAPSGSKYVVSAYFEKSDANYYYVILTNQSGSAAQNASYTASLPFDRT